MNTMDLLRYDRLDIEFLLFQTDFYTNNKTHLPDRLLN